MTVTNKGRMVTAMLPLLAGGCVARTAWDVATAPVRATSQVVDWTTTSQSEADRNYGRKVRKEEAKRGRELRDAQRRCHDHPDDQGACDTAQRLAEQPLPDR